MPDQPEAPAPVSTVACEVLQRPAVPQGITVGMAVNDDEMVDDLEGKFSCSGCGAGGDLGSQQSAAVPGLGASSSQPAVGSWSAVAAEDRRSVLAAQFTQLTKQGRWSEAAGRLAMMDDEPEGIEEGGGGVQ